MVIGIDAERGLKRILCGHPLTFPQVQSSNRLMNHYQIRIDLPGFESRFLGAAIIDRRIDRAAVDLGNMRRYQLVNERQRSPGGRKIRVPVDGLLQHGLGIQER